MNPLRGPLEPGRPYRISGWGLLPGGHWRGIVVLKRAYVLDLGPPLTVLDAVTGHACALEPPFRFQFA